jgi:ADP-heptose:LPS heptosyltransferase
VRLGAVGDVVRTLPAATALRAGLPKARLTWLVEPASASLLRGQPWLDEVLEFPRPALRSALRGVDLAKGVGAAREFVRLLRKGRFDLVVDFHGILKSGVLSRLTGTARRVGYAAPFAREGAQWFASESAQLTPARQSRFERNDALVRYLGISQPPARQPLVIDPRARDRALQLLGGGSAPIAIHPGTSEHTPHKRYPARAFGEVARALAEQGGVECIVTRGPGPAELAYAEQVVSTSGGAARLAPETPSLLDLAAVFSACRLYLGGDTGPLHVASLVGTPVVQLLGPTDPVENTPYPGTPSRTLRVQIGCNPCRRGCAAATCMRVIQPESVVAAASDLLAGGMAGC